MDLIARRAIAFIIDSIIVGVPTFLISSIFVVSRFLLSVLLPFISRPSHATTMMIIGFVIYCTYETIAMYVFNTTIGKLAMELRVSGTQTRGYTDFWTIFLRSILKVLSLVSTFSILLVFNLLYIFIKDEHKSIHDLVAKTSVWKK